MKYSLEELRNFVNQTWHVPTMCSCGPDRAL